MSAISGAVSRPARAPGGKPKDLRLAALRRFALAITVLNVAGHFFLGFEQAWAHPLVALATAYAMEILLESVHAGLTGKRPRFLGCGFVGLVNFLLSAHITGLAVAMLLYPNERLWPVVFGVAVAVGSKYIFRVPVPGGGTRHFLNPSNFGITATLLTFPWVGLAPPYMFTENISGVADWILPGVFITIGTLLNGRFTKKLPLIGAWVAGFAAQALVRIVLGGSTTAAPLVTMTGIGFLLFTFYMVTDPATTPTGKRGQILFGGGVALAYAVVTSLHVVFGLFFALTVVCALRGALLQVQAWRRATVPARAPASLELAPERAAATGLLVSRSADSEWSRRQ
jgi:Na+-translocating ferredoxin:NAD+ oxidoreductase RnfD subunit